LAAYPSGAHAGEWGALRRLSGECIVTAQTVEYLVRLRFDEPAAMLPPGQVGDVMHTLLDELEIAAEDVEIVSRCIVGDPDRPPRVKCPTSDLWGDRHFVTDRRWTLASPEGGETVLCSAACALAWICYALPSDFKAASSESESEAA
jgi:hypothetical protein